MTLIGVLPVGLADDDFDVVFGGVFAADFTGAFTGAAFFAGALTGRDDVFDAFAGAFRTACLATFFAGALAVFFGAAFIGPPLRAGAAFFAGFAGAFDDLDGAFFAEAGAGFEAFFTVVLRTGAVDFFAVRETFADAEEREADFFAGGLVFDLAFEAMLTSGHASVSSARGLRTRRLRRAKIVSLYAVTLPDTTACSALASR